MKRYDENLRRKDSAGKLHRYEWVGYLSIIVLLLGLMLGRYLF